MKRLRIVLACAGLQLGVLMGVPMRPDEIKELMHQMNQPKLAHVLPGKDDEGGDAGSSDIPSSSKSPAAT
jgi:hypothetical protein